MRLNPWRRRVDIHVYVAEYAARIDIGPAIRRVEGPNLEAVRTEAVRMLVALAIEQGRDFRVMAHGPEGKTPLTVSATGVVKIDASADGRDRGVALAARTPAAAIILTLLLLVVVLVLLLG